MIDLANAKGLRIYTDFLEYIGNYTITVTATMERYPEDWEMGRKEKSMRCSCHG